MEEKSNSRSPEEIKAAVDYCSHDTCGDNDECAYLDVEIRCWEKVMKDALVYIQHLESPQPKWISVEERLPEEKESVLVHYVDGWMPIAFLLDGKWYQSNGEMSWLSVTHWMPLPQPPEEDE